MTKKTSPEALSDLKAALNDAGVVKGDTVYAILHSVSRTGMSRDISFVVFKGKKPYYLDYPISKAFPYFKRDNARGLKIRGTGMDMAFHVVSTVAEAVYGDYKALRSERL